MLIDTDAPERTAPAAGLNVGVAAGARIVYTAKAPAESASPGAVAMAWTLVAAVMAIGVVYIVDEVPGAVPSVV